MPSSPPLSIIHLAPFLDPPKHTTTNVRPQQPRPLSTLSTVSSSSNLSTTSTAFTNSTIKSPPPSSFFRRSRSQDLFAGLRLFAPSSISPTKLESDQQISVIPEKKVIHLEEIIESPPPQIMSTASPPPPPPKKPGFFRRMSSSSQSHSPPSPPSHHSPQPPLPRKSTFRSASGPARRNDDAMLAGPSYESLPHGSAQVYRSHDTVIPPIASGSGSGSGTPRSKSRERGLFTRSDRNKSTPFPNLPQTPGRSSSSSYPVTSTYSDNHTPIAAAFSRSSPPVSTPNPTLPTSVPVNRRNPVYPALASPPNSPPRNNQENHLSFTSPLELGRFPASSPQKPMTYSRPAGLDYENPKVEIREEKMFPGNGVVSGSKRASMGEENGKKHQGRMSLGPTSITLPPQNKMTYEIIASSSNTPRTPVARVNGVMTPRPAAGQVQPPLPNISRDRFPKSDTMSRFADAEGQDLVEQLIPNGVATQLPPRKDSIPLDSTPRPVVSARRTNSTSRPIPRASIGRDSLETPRAHPAASSSPPPKTIGSDSKRSSDMTPTAATPRALLNRPPSSYFSTPGMGNDRPSPKPADGQTEASAYAKAVAPILASHQSPQKVPSPPPVAAKSDRRTSRPLPQPPTLSASISAISLSDKKPKQISPTSPRNHFTIIASNDGTGRRNSATSVDSVTRRSSVTRKSSTESTRGRRTSQSSDKRRPRISIPSHPDEGSPNQSNKLALVVEDEKRFSQPPILIDFPRSATLPPLDDPREKDAARPLHLPDEVFPRNPIEKWATDVGATEVVSPSLKSSPVLPSNHLPPRVSSAQGRRVASSPLASPVFASSGRMTASPTAFQSLQPQNRSVSAQSRPPTGHSRQSVQTINSGSKLPTIPRGRGLPSLAFVISHPRIANHLLPFLSINSFLSLMGYSEVVRKQFTGEMVGRWVMKEWGIQIDKERGRTWPGLAVWEGFLESLLHDPSGYSTYSAQYHGLLQHLCLSHTLIVLHLRQLPPACFPNSTLMPFEDDPGMAAPNLPYSNSLASMSSVGGFNPTRSRLSSTAGSDAGSLAPGKMPRTERLVEIIMPEPLGSQPKEELSSPPTEMTSGKKKSRRGSVGSMASVTSFAFGRKRANSTAATEIRADMATSITGSAVSHAAPMMQGKASLPPVSYPTAKRYGFKTHGDPASGRSRTSSESGRPGSIFSVQSSPSVSYHQRMSAGYSQRGSFAVDRNAPPVPGFPAGLPMPPPIGGGAPIGNGNGNGNGGRNHRASFASTSDAGRSSRRSDYGGGSHSPIQGRFGSPSNFPRRDFNTPPPRVELAFERPPPYTHGRAPILRVFVPLSESVQRWPSAEGAYFAVKELEKCGAVKRLRLGDLVVNTAIRQPMTTEHVLVYVPHVKHLLVPLEYTYSPTGHLPNYIDSFTLPPSYYYPFLPSPQIIYLNLAPYANQALHSMRLAYDRRDVTVASGARLSAKRYLHVAGFEVKSGDLTVGGGQVAPEWEGMVSLESEGTQEGKMDMEKRFGGGDPRLAGMGPWEIVREKSMMGTVWLRLVREGGMDGVRG